MGWLRRAELLSPMMGVPKNDRAQKEQRKKDTKPSFFSITTSMLCLYQMKMAQITGIAQFTVQLEFSITLNMRGLKVSRQKRSSGNVRADTERASPRAASQCCEGLVQPRAKALV